MGYLWTEGVYNFTTSYGNVKFEWHSRKFLLVKEFSIGLVRNVKPPG